MKKKEKGEIIKDQKTDPFVITPPPKPEMTKEEKSKMSLNEFDMKYFINELSYQNTVNKIELANITISHEAIIFKSFDDQKRYIDTKFNEVREGILTFERNKQAIYAAGDIYGMVVGLRDEFKATVRHGIQLIVGLVVAFTVMMALFILLFLPWYHKKITYYMAPTIKQSEYLQQASVKTVYEYPKKTFNYLAFPVDIDNIKQ
jgi:hypothetical protein